VEAELRLDDDDDTAFGSAVPSDEPVDAPGKRRRLPVPEFFSRRAFLSKDTGRWHKLPGGRDRHDEPKK
jgi:hypothetical protein